MGYFGLLLDAEILSGPRRPCAQNLRHNPRYIFISRTFHNYYAFLSFSLSKLLVLCVAGKLRMRPQARITPMKSLIVRPEERYKEWKIIVPDDKSMSEEEREFRYYSALTMMASKLAYQHHLFVNFVATYCWKVTKRSSTFCIFFV